MQNPRLAARYAKSIIDLSQEQNLLDAVHNDMLLIDAACKSNKDFTLMLRSPIIKADTKKNILKSIFEGKVNNLTSLLFDLIVNKGREANLPEIATAFIQQYQQIKRVQTVKLTTAFPIDEELKQLIQNKVAANFKEGTVSIDTDVDPELIGGFVLEAGDKLFDGSIRRDLNDIKNQFTKNLFVADI